MPPKTRFVIHVPGKTDIGCDTADAVLDLLLGLRRLVGSREVVDRDVRTVLGEAHGDRLADAGAAAGHEHVFSLQSSHRFLSRFGGGNGHLFLLYIDRTGFARFSALATTCVTRGVAVGAGRAAS